MNSAAAVLAAAVLAAASAVSRAEPQPLPRSLDEAVASATANRLSVRIAEVAAQGAAQRVRQAQASFRPTIRLTSELLATNNYDAFTGTTASVNIPSLGLTSSIDITRSIPRYQFTPALRLDYGVYSGGRDTAALSEAESRQRVAQAEQDIAVRQVTQDVAQAYLQVRRACVLRDRAASRQTLAEAQAALAARRLAEGRLAEIDYRSSALALAESRLELRSRGTELESAVAAFVATLGDADRPSAPDPASACRFDSTLAADMAMLERRADGDPQAARREYEAQAAAARVDVERSARRAQLSLYAQYAGVARSGSWTDGNLAHVDRRDAVIGIQLSYTLFDGSYAESRVAESRLEATRIRLRNEAAAAERLQAQQKNALLVQSAETQLELARGRSELAAARRALAAQRLDKGTGSSIALDEASSQQRDASLAMTLAEIDVAIARVGLLFPATSPTH